MNTTITSRKLGQTFHFFAPNGGGYIHLTTENRPGTLGAQICEGGGFRGSTIRCTDEDDFKAECRRWVRQHVAAEAQATA